jgi:hypothetical protein
MIDREFELQILDGRDYRTTARGDYRTMAAAFETMKQPRRLVLTSKARPARACYRRPAGTRAPAMSKAETKRAYLLWAERAGVECVTFYEGDREGLIWSARHVARFVPVADILGPAPDAEPEA